MPQTSGKKRDPPICTANPSFLPFFVLKPKFTLLKEYKESSEFSLKSKIISAQEAVSKLQDGMTIMIGGFLSTGAPETLIDEIVRQGIGNLTVICNDTGVTGTGISKLVHARLLKKVITSHIGTNPETGRQMMAGELEVELVPQGTLAERIRAGGAGLGGFLTPTGIGTEVAVGKDLHTVDGKEYLLELPLKADVALIRGSVVDTRGNMLYYGTTRNFSPIMATAASLVIAEAERVVPVGEMDPNHVVTPGLFVDYVVEEAQ
ncbi:MAG: branched-chain amino acid dehydrogenase [Firmicutes bacterium]|nr:branched-chain amino acid dehydrogenase [Bacillota bacterium]